MKHLFMPRLFLLVLILLLQDYCYGQSDTALTAAMTAAIRQQSYPDIHSLLISKNGVTTYEQYFNAFTRDALHDTRSSFKSITSLLLGIAVDKGFIKDIHTPVYRFFPENHSVNTDLRKKEITIQHLLEMSAGFDCDEWTDKGPDCESMMDQSADWVQFALNLPMKNTPGKVWAYTSINPMIIGGIIRKATGMSVMDFAGRYLFKPLDITTCRWTVDAAGNGMTAGSFYMLPADMLKIGNLVLHKGTWQGKRIISEKWLRTATTDRWLIPGSSFVQSGNAAAAIPQPTHYAFYWYNETVQTKDFRYNLLFASGNGGQYIMIIRELGLVAVFTQGNYGKRRAKQAFDILVKYIIPAYR